MSCAALLALTIVASTGGADVVVLDLKAAGADESEVRVLDGLLSEEIARHVAGWPEKRPKVATSDDIRTLISLEANKAAVGCDDTSCLAEVAQAFGARYVVTGSVGRLGSQTVLQLWLFDVDKAATVARTSIEGSDASALRAALPRIVDEVLAPLAPRGSGIGSSLVISGAVVAGASAVIAVSAGGLALLLDQRLAAGSDASPSEKRQALDLGPAVIVTSAIAAGVALIGGALVGAGVAMGDS